MGDLPHLLHGMVLGHPWSAGRWCSKTTALRCASAASETPEVGD